MTLVLSTLSESRRMASTPECLMFIRESIRGASSRTHLDMFVYFFIRFRESQKYPRPLLAQSHQCLGSLLECMYKQCSKLLRTFTCAPCVYWVKVYAPTADNLAEIAQTMQQHDLLQLQALGPRTSRRLKTGKGDKLLFGNSEVNHFLSAPTRSNPWFFQGPHSTIVIASWVLDKYTLGEGIIQVM